MSFSPFPSSADQPWSRGRREEGQTGGCAQQQTAVLDADMHQVSYVACTTAAVHRMYDVMYVSYTTAVYICTKNQRQNNQQAVDSIVQTRQQQCLDSSSISLIKKNRGSVFRSHQLVGDFNRMYLQQAAVVVQQVKYDTHLLFLRSTGYHTPDPASYDIWCFLLFISLVFRRGLGTKGRGELRASAAVVVGVVVITHGDTRRYWGSYGNWWYRQQCTHT